MIRLLAHSALFLSIFFSPWWVAVVVALFAFFLVEDFYDGILWGIAADALYGTPIASLLGFDLIFTALMAVSFACMHVLKSALRSHDLGTLRV